MQKKIIVYICINIINPFEFALSFLSIKVKSEKERDNDNDNDKINPQQVLKYYV